MSAANDVQIRLMMTGVPAVLAQLNQLNSGVRVSTQAFQRMNQGMHSVSQALGSISSLAPQIGELHKMTTAAIATTSAMSALASVFSKGAFRGFLIGAAAITGVLTIMEGVATHQAIDQAVKASEELAKSQALTSDKLRENIELQERFGKITKERAEELRKILKFSDDFHTSGIEGGADNRQSLLNNMASELRKSGGLGVKAEREMLDLQIAENRLVTDKFKLNGANTSEMLKQLEIERNLITEKRQASSDALQTGTIKEVEFRGLELKDRADILNIEREIARIQEQANRDNVRTATERLRLLQEQAEAITRQVETQAGWLALQNQKDPTFGGMDNERDLKIAAEMERAQQAREAEALMHQQRLTELDELTVAEESRRAMREQAEGLHAQNLVNIQSEAALRIAQVEAEADQKKKQLRDAQLTGTQTMFTNMATAAKAFGKEGFLAYKAFAIAAATVETYKSAVAAYSATVGIPYVGPFIAPIAAGAAIAAGMANISQIAAQSYAVGGYTGAGGKYEPAGMVHRDEFVMNSETVGRVGIGALQAIQDGDLEPAGGGGNVSIALVDNGRDARRFLESREGRQLIIDTISRQRGEV